MRGELGNKANEASFKLVGYCEAAKLLLDDFGETVHQVLVCHEQQFLAMVSKETRKPAALIS